VTDSLVAGLDLLAGLLTQEEPRQTGPDFGKASPFGFFVVILLLIGTFFLVWSMNRHLKRLPESFDRDHPELDQAVDEGTVGSEPDNGTAAGSTTRDPG